MCGGGLVNGCRLHMGWRARTRQRAPQGCSRLHKCVGHTCVYTEEHVRHCCEALEVVMGQDDACPPEHTR